MNGDPELQAMSQIRGLLDELEGDTRARVIRWTAERYGVVLTGGPEQNSYGAIRQPVTDGAAFTDFASLYDASNPKSDTEKALIAGYWFQVVKGQPDFGALEINTELKHLGHGVSNITTALTGLMTRKPRWAMQTHKSGRSRQARKRYKLTNEGVRAATNMLGPGHTEA